MRNVAVALTSLVLAVAGCSDTGRPMTAAAPAPVPASTGNAAPAGHLDADAHGFFVYGQGARCLRTDNAELYMRTENSALVVCRSETDRLYYRGFRLSDGAAIELHEVSRQPGGFVAVNAPDDARYVITSEGFQLFQHGAVVLSESAVEVGPESAAHPPAAQPAAQPAAPPVSKVVLGAVGSLGPYSRGYGTEQPDVVSMGNCASAISKIVWQDWGAPVAHGSGLGCVQAGEPPRYPLVASNIGMCQGVLAYRTLQTSTNPPQDICDQ